MGLDILVVQSCITICRLFESRGIVIELGILWSKSCMVYHRLTKAQVLL
jgi:hypothetical protein